MFEKLSILGKELLLETLPKLTAGEITPIPQAGEEATFSPNTTREQERTDWQKTVEAIDNHCFSHIPPSPRDATILIG